MFAVKMSLSGGIVNFFDFDPLQKYESLHLPELIATQHCSTDHMTTNSPL